MKEITVLISAHGEGLFGILLLGNGHEEEEREEREERKEEEQEKPNGVWRCI